MDKGVILVGGFHEIIELCEDLDLRIEGIIDNNIRGEYFGYPIIGTDSDAEKLFSSIGKLPLIITPDLPKIREELIRYYIAFGFKFKSLIAPNSTISRSAQIGTGSIIQRDVNISSAVRIGDFVKINTMANVMHDCVIGNYTTIAPNAVILGRVSIDEKSYIGANSTILPDLTIGNNAIVGAGAVVVKNVKEGTTVKGVPAK